MQGRHGLQHLVSMMTTRRLHSAASMREMSLNTVVFPDPGRPRIRMDFPLLARSAISAALPGTARPTRQVSPTMPPSRLRRQLMRCSVRSMPARLSSPNSPTLRAFVQLQSLALIITQLQQCLAVQTYVRPLLSGIDLRL